MTPNEILISGIYYFLVAVLSLFSIFGVYILILYGKSRGLALTIAIVYALFFIKILAESYQTLHSLLSWFINFIISAS